MFKIFNKFSSKYLKKLNHTSGGNYSEKKMLLSTFCYLFRLFRKISLKFDILLLDNLEKENAFMEKIFFLS